MKPENFAGAVPALVLEDYFSGHTKAWGLFTDRFGIVRRQFSVDISGDWDGGRLILNESFLYNDGASESRIWTIRKTGEGLYEGRADDVIGIAQGRAAGNALNWSYKMDLKVGARSWRVAFDDWMFLQPDGVMINRASVSKWGIEIGQVTLFFAKPGVTGAAKQGAS